MSNKSKLKIFFRKNLFLIALLGIFFAFLFIPNVKVYLAALFLFSLILFFIFQRSFMDALYLLILTTISFEKGIRDWLIPIVEDGALPWETSYNMYFGISLKLVFSAALLIGYCFTKKRQSNLASQPGQSWMLDGFFAFTILSTIMSPDFWLSALGLIRIAMACVIYFMGLFLFRSTRFQSHFIQLIIVLLLFLGFIGSMQTLRKQPLGLFLEDTAYSKPFGFLTTDGEPIFRASGTLGHPTFFGSYLSLLLPIATAFLIQNWQKVRQNRLMNTMAIAALATGIIALVGTLSRSSWIAMAVAIGVLLTKFFHQADSHAHIRKAIVIASIAFVSLGALFSPLLTARFQTFDDVFTIGNGRGRINLIRESITMIKESPVLGTGLNLFTRVMDGHNPEPDVRVFLYPVHNTFLLFLTETGIAGGGFYIFFFISTLLLTFRRARQSWISWGVWVGTMTFLINAQFHTLFNQDPTFDMTMVMLAYLNSL